MPMHLNSDERVRLVRPSADFAESYRDFVAEFLKESEPLVPFTLTFPNHDFPAFLQQLSKAARGEGLPPGFVAHSTYWLVRDDVEVVAVSNLRHALSPSLRRDGGLIGYGVRPTLRRQGHGATLLKLTLEQARRLGFDDALLTCSKKNMKSIRTILRNHGRLDSEEYLAERGEVVQRYLVPVLTSDHGT